MKVGQQQTTCIYCRTVVRGRVPREHVIPQAFGKFRNNFVLRCVCGSCNHYFSEELELFLARDSGEALLRLRYGLKSASEAHELKRTRVSLRVDLPGPWLGAHIILKADTSGQKVESELVPQVAFRKKPKGEWVWFTEDQLTGPEVVEMYKKDVEIRIVGPSAAATERLRCKLERLGVRFKQQGVLDQPITDAGNIQAQMLYRIDEVIFRGIGKIAFNYLAHAQSPRFALEKDFDPIRKYVRYSCKSSWPQVIASTRPILSGDTQLWRQTNGHLIVLDWNKSGKGIVAQVSLFNSITYHVLLCQDYSGLWRPLQSGHHFDIETREISSLAGVTIV